MSTDLKNKLDRNIWITRKCRINASERLLSTAKYIDVLNVYYSIFIILVSLISLIDHNDNLSLVSLVGSIALTISIIYANTTGLKERSNALKKNYIGLQELLDQLACTENTQTEDLLQISEMYAKLLEESENHLDVDLYKAKSGLTEENFKLNGKERACWYAYKAWTCAWRVCLILIPIVWLFWYWFVR